MATRNTLRQDMAANVKDRFLGSVSNVVGVNIQSTSSDVVYKPDGAFDDAQLYVYDGPGAGVERRVQAHTQNLTGTVYAQFAPYGSVPGVVAGSSSFEVHPSTGWTIDEYHLAIARAHESAKDIATVYLTDTSLTMEAGRHLYPMPSGWRWINQVAYDQTPQPTGTAPGSAYQEGVTTWGSSFYDQDRGLYATSAQYKLSQGFSASGDTSGFWMGSVRLYLRKVGSPPGQSLSVSIQTDAAGKPSGTSVAGGASSSVSSSTISPTPGWVCFDFPAPVFVGNKVPLHVVLSTDALAADAANFVAWGEDTSTSYNRGAACAQSAGVWSSIPNSALLFVVEKAANRQRFVVMARDDWDTVPGQGMLWVKRPVEGRTLRIEGQGNPAAPVTDFDTIKLPLPYALAKATFHLLSMRGGGPATDSDARDRWALAWDQQAERELPRLMVPVRPNSRAVDVRQ